MPLSTGGMNWVLLLTDLIPVLIFVILDSRGKIKYAVIGAVSAAALELFFSYFFFGGVDTFSLIYVGLFLFFGALSFKFNNSLFFKLKPVAISTVTGIIFLVGQLTDNPVLVVLMERYGHLLGASQLEQLSSATTVILLERASLYMIFGLFLHAALVAWVAVHHSTWWWFVARTGGGFLITVLVILLAM
jgi:intracellular septation protein A